MVMGGVFCLVGTRGEVLYIKNMGKKFSIDIKLKEKKKKKSLPFHGIGYYNLLR